MTHAPTSAPQRDPLAGLSIELAGTGDLGTIAALATRIWRKHYPGIISQRQIEYMLASRYSPDKLEAEAAKPGHSFLILRTAGTAIGYAALAKADDAPHELVLRSFYLDPELHGQGYGRAFMTHIVELAQARGFHEITLTVNRRNIKAINFYFKAGYTIRSAVDLAIGHGFTLDDFIMVARLP
jgi:ribosomal protein S18 acetylase RimI-like enzyme